MNPFTKYLSQWSFDRDFAGFVEHWDRLEHLVVAVYRQKLDANLAKAEFDEVWPRCRELYLGRWEKLLQSYWLQTRAAGEPTRVDPFRLLLDIQSPIEIPENWRAMQYLPAAREAINRYLLDHDFEKELERR